MRGDYLLESQIILSAREIFLKDLKISHWDITRFEQFLCLPQIFIK